MKVLHVITILERGGAEAMLYKLLSETDRERFQPVVVSLVPGGVYAEKLQAAGIPVYSLGLRRMLPNPMALATMKRLVRQLEPDVIHSWMYHAAMVTLMVASKYPIVMAIHHALHDIEGEKLLTRHVIKRLAPMSSAADRIVYCATASRKQHEALGYSEKAGITIPNGFDCDLFRPMQPEGALLRAEIGLEEDSFVIGHIGRYHETKDHDSLVTAFASVAECSSNARLVMAGSGVNAENNVLRLRIAELGLQHRVHLLGERDDVPKLINVFDALVNCSRSESFPNVLGEAMASGVPCVATDVGDSAKIVGDTGLIVPPREPKLLAAAIHQMMAFSSEDRARRGRRARCRIIDHFSLARAVEGYERLYVDILDQRLQQADQA